jgi:hypothetical protein
LNALEVLTRRLAKVEARQPVDEPYCALLRELIETEKLWLELKALCAEFSPQLETFIEALKIARGEKIERSPDKFLKALEDTRKAIANLKDCPTH